MSARLQESPRLMLGFVAKAVLFLRTFNLHALLEKGVPLKVSDTVFPQIQPGAFSIWPQDAADRRARRLTLELETF